MRAYTRAALAHPWLLLFIFLAALVMQGAAVAGPLFIREFIDTLSSGLVSDVVVTGLLGVLAVYAGVMLVSWAAQFIQNIALSRMDSSVMVELSNRAFGYLIRHGHDFFSSNFAGALTRKVNRYARAFEQVLDTVVYSFFSTSVFAVGAIYVLAQKSVLLAAGMLAWAVFFIVVQIVITRWRQPLRVARTEEDSKVTGVLSDAISNHSTVSLFAATTHEQTVFAAASERWRAATMRAWSADVSVTAVQGLFAIFIEVGLLVGAVFLWKNGLMSVGDFVLMQMYIISLVNRIWGIGNSMRRVYDAFADAHEMVVILEKPHAVQDASGARDIAVSTGAISMQNISFGFENGRTVLKDFSLHISGGERIALVGPSGAGKSTVTKLLLRLYDVHEGAIEIDGQNISAVTQDSLRRAIAFVPQEPILFHRSLKENIRYGRPGATDEEVIEAAKKARCHDFISALPLAYETHVGERGIKLSGGERQRVAIARAILKNAPILILDEATSSLDSESEALIQDALNVLMEGKTVVVIAHRLSTIMSMDRIVVVEGGAIVAEGTHQELLNRNGGLYHKLWSIQAGSFLNDAE